MKNAIFLLFYSLLGCLPVAAQRIMNVPQSDKLPVQSVNRIFQDREGYIWYGTGDGLCRDDGYNIQVFRTNRYNKTAMRSNLIGTLTEDSRSRLWMGTEQGVYILDKSTYQIHALSIPQIEDKLIIHLKATSDKSVWVSVADTLYCFAEDETLIQAFPIDKGAGVVDYLYEDNRSNIWICIKGAGLFRLEKSTGEIINFSSSRAENELCILQDRNEQYFWVGIWGYGVARFDPNATGKAMYTYQPATLQKEGGVDDRVIYMEQDDVNGYLWVVTYSDLLAFNINEEGMLERVDTSNLLPVQSKMLTAIIKDRDKNLWISAFDRKSFIINLKEKTVNEYSIPAFSRRFHAQPAVNSLCRDEEGVFWLLLWRYGLCLYNAETDILIHSEDCPETRNVPLWSNSLLLKSAKHGKVWFMSGDSRIWGIRQSGMQMHMEEELDLKKEYDAPGKLRVMHEDKQGKLWLGTTTGVFVYSPKYKKFTQLHGINGTVTGITETADGMIWICVSNQGVYSVENNKCNKYYPDENDFSCISATSDGKLWVGTYSGSIFLLNPQKEKDFYEDYSRTCGMNGDILEMLIVDDFNHVWIVTNQRVKEFNPRNNVYHDYTIPSEAILLNRYLPRSAYQHTDGTLYFGGIPGFVSMHSGNQLESIPRKVETLITDIKVGEKSLLFDFHQLLADNMVTLSPDSYNIRIEFSSLDYWNAPLIRYAYRLKGIDNEWNYTDNGRNSAFYNRLDKGEYTFQVKCTDENGLWSNRITEITVRRLPAWYETWWAYSCYALLGGILISLVLYLYLQKIRQENSKLLTEQLAQMKLRYFTNISHDLMTPLSILSCIADEMQKDSLQNARLINMLRSNTQRLKRLLQQVLDFRKIENRSMKLTVAYGDVSGLIKDLCYNSFDPLIQNKHIPFSLSLHPDKIEGWFDADKLDKILFNLLSNAFKYTPDEKPVSVSVHTSGQEGHILLHVVVKDKGQGIEQKEQEKIFTRFYHNKNAESRMSNGVGLSIVKELVELHHGTIHLESEWKKGSTFTVTIPIDRDSYAKKDLLESTFDMKSVEIDAGIFGTEEVARESQPGEYSLLLVEDNEDLLQLMRNSFLKHYRTFTATNGKEALEIINQNSVDIVISDIMMPGMNGLELCKTLKNDLATSHIIVILLTAKTASEDRIESYRVNADAYMTKPFEIRVLEARLENLLRLRKQRQESFQKNPKIEINQLEFSSLDEQLISKALLIVEENLDNPGFDVSQLAGSLNVSRATSSRKMKAVVGQTPLEFIRDIKMKHACRMLENPNTTIGEVVVALGYNDHKYFTNAFKETFGVTPSEYQKNRGKS